MIHVNMNEKFVFKLISTLIQTGGYVHTYETTQQKTHRHTTHRLEIAGSLHQNKGLQLLNILPDRINIVEIVKICKIQHKEQLFF